MLLKLSRVYCCSPLLQLEHVGACGFLPDACKFAMCLPSWLWVCKCKLCMHVCHVFTIMAFPSFSSMLCQSSWQSQDYLALIFSEIFSQLLKPRTIFLSQSSQALGNLFSSPGKSLEADVPIKHEKHSRKASEAQVILISSTFRHCCNVTHIFKIGT